MIAMFITDSDWRTQLEFADTLSDGCEPVYSADQYVAVRKARDELREVATDARAAAPEVYDRLLARMNKLCADYENLDPVKLFNDQMMRHFPNKGAVS